MGKLLGIILLVVSLTGYAKETIIISDLDDTIKVTYSHRTKDAIFKGIWSKKVFTGNRILYNAFAKYTKKTVVLTASYDVLEDHIRETLKQNYIPYAKLIMRDFSSPDKFTYKYNNIRDILDNSDYNVILLGDDSGDDAAVYDEIEKNYPQRVLARYIRPVVGNKLPKGTIPFYTAYDVAAYEYQQGRLTAADLGRVAKRILTERKGKNIIPKTFFCPATYVAPKGVETKAAKDLTNKIRAICAQRNHEMRQGQIIWYEDDFR